MKLDKENIFDGIPPVLGKELFQTLAESSTVRVERIVSDGHATPEGEWYDQGWDEWVILISGSATLLINGESNLQVLKPGDHLMIPAGCRHRVESTTAGQKTIWLAVHFLENYKACSA